MTKIWIERIVVPLLFVVAASALSLYLLCMKSIKDESAQSSAIQIQESYLISSYDAIFQEVGAAWGVDWLLLAAIARSESEFRYDAVSPSGAVGLMQIMPYVAANMGVERSELFDPRRNVEIAAELLHSIDDMLHLDEGFDERERLCFTLAGYNAGYLRIADARRLAKYYGDDDRKWSVVSTYLAMLCEEEYFELEVVRGGAFYGSDETIAYVSKVMHRLDCYRTDIIGL